MMPAGQIHRHPTEEHMALFIVTINWTEQGIRSVKDAPKRSQAAKDLAKRLGAEIKQIYLTSGDSDLLAIVEAANGDSVAKLAMALGAQGNIRTRTARAWTEPEFTKLIAELP
jgi:uncharacterized protein with GYD domain